MKGYAPRIGFVKEVQDNRRKWTFAFGLDGREGIGSQLKKLEPKFSNSSV